MNDNNIERFERIEAYLLGRLSGKDLASFETEMNADPDLAEEVALQKEIFKAIQNKEVRAFKKTLEDIRAKRKRTRGGKKKPILMRRILSLAAAILLLVVAGYWWSNSGPFSSMSSDELYAANFEVPNYLAVRPNRSKGRDMEGDSLSYEDALWKKVENFYQEKKYQETYELLTEVADSTYGKFSHEINYQMGVLSLLLNRYEQAVQHFDKVEDGHADSKIWYKALALLKLEGHLPEAKATLEEIVNGSGSKTIKKKAKAILKKLD